MSLDLNESTQKYNELNDNIIDFYMNMICYHFANKSISTVSSLTTKKFLTNDRLELLNNWHNKINLFQYKILFLPLCNDKHWVLFCINTDHKIIIFMNSLVKLVDIKLIKLYFGSIRTLLEANAKHNRIDFNFNEWKLANLKNLPQQTNSVDCGVFICMFARFIASDFKIDFNQSNMTYFRNIIKEELSKFELKTIDKIQTIPDFAIWA